MLREVWRGEGKGSKRNIALDFQKCRTVLWMSSSELGSPCCCFHGHLPLEGGYCHICGLHFPMGHEKQICKTKSHLQESEPLGWSIINFYKFCDFLGGWKQKCALWVKNKNNQICFCRNLKLCHANTLSELTSLFQRVYRLIISFTSPLRIMLVFNAF